MTPPPRGKNPENEELETYVHRNNGTLVYRRRGYPPQQLGNDVATANELARQITAMINGEIALPDPLETYRERMQRPTLPGGSPALMVVADAWEAHWRAEERPAKGTIDNTGWRLARIKNHFPDRELHSITTAEIAALLETETRSEYPKIKSVLVRMFVYAKEQGWYPSQWPNPAGETGNRRGKEKDRERMSVPQYEAIYQRAPAWLQRTMATALYTLLRRGDLARLRLDDTDPNYFLRDNVLHAIPQKSKTRKRKGGPSRLRWDLREHPHLATLVHEARIESMALGRCPFMICTKPERITAAAKAVKVHHAQVLPARISRALAEARALAIAETDLFEGYTAEQLPGLHEIRALGSWLLKKSKADQKAVSELMAHTDEKMTEGYQSDHEEEWVTVGLRGAIIDQKTA